MALLVALVATLHLVPQPAHLETRTCSRPPSVPLSVAATFDPGAREELDERWGGLGIGQVATVGAADAAIIVRHDSSLAPEAYRLTIRSNGATIDSSTAAGAFYATMTLAQLPFRSDGRWVLPCVAIADHPALRWRILSDDVSRGPLPTMRYFEERIRTISAFKMNGYSPYMEHVFVSPTDPLPAPLDGITPAQLRALSVYAARFHVALVPEQQTFAHMHNTLRIEEYASAAELPHGFLLAPNVRLGQAYLDRIVRQELDAVDRPPFFHIGSDETATLGLGQTKAYVERRGRSQAYADHIVGMNRLIAPSGARIMLWDDGIENDPDIMKLIPPTAVVVNWHYGDEPTFEPYIRTIAAGCLEQMVAPGASNWNEIFPAVDTALGNEGRFIDEGKRARVLGLFQTVWHDDGETLYEATWYPVLYAAAAGWQQEGPSQQQFADDFPSAFFGVDDPAYARDVLELGSVLRRLEPSPTYYTQTDALFWADPFDDRAQARLANVDLTSVRLSAEAVERDLYFKRPPLHRNAAWVMFLAARRYDALARKFQIGGEVRTMYTQALSSAAGDRTTTIRDLMWCRYWMWELRDAYEELAPLYARAWNYESRPEHLPGNLERYHLAAQVAIERADRFARVIDAYASSQPLPDLDTVLREAQAP